MANESKNQNSLFDTETIQLAIIGFCIVVGLSVVVGGIVMLNRQSNAYWGPIVIACTQDGGTMVNGACYGARK